MIPFITVVAILFLSVLESVSYVGFVSSHILLPSWVFYISGFFILWIKPPVTASSIFKILGKILAVLTSALFVILSWLEAFTYQNFVYSKFHLNLTGFAYLTFFTIFTGYLFSGQRSRLSFSKSALKSLLVFIFVFNISSFVPLIYRSSRDLITRPLASYDDKLTSAYPGFYPAMQMITALTPADATIYLPPQGAPWVTEGNAYLVNRFLYPRKTENLQSSLNIKPHSYLLIARGSWPTDGTYEYGWPKEKINATRIWQFDVKNRESFEFARDYDPSCDKWDWGLIEVQND